MGAALKYEPSEKAIAQRLPGRRKMVGDDIGVEDPPKPKREKPPKMEPGDILGKPISPSQQLRRAFMAQRVEVNARLRRIRLAEQDHYERTWLDQPRSIHPELRMCKPTPETAEKMQPDPIERLYEIGLKSGGKRGLIGEQRDAALEIRAVYQAVAGALLSRSAWPDGRTPGRSGGMAEWLATAYEGRYKPWANDLSRRLVLTGSPILEVTISIAALGESCGDVDTAFRWKHGRAAELLGEALTLYAAMMERPQRRRHTIR